jgi:hypothetical protein
MDAASSNLGIGSSQTICVPHSLLFPIGCGGRDHYQVVSFNSIW